jgi:hypothetical protein
MTKAPRLVRAVLIDPFECAVTEVTIDGDDYTTIAPLLSHPTIRVDYFQKVSSLNLAGRDSLYVDEEGMLKAPQRFFIIMGFPQPIAGKGLVTGCDEDGRAIAATSDTALISGAVYFVEMTEIGALRATTRPYEWEWIQ